ncbi:disrupted in schizophrenia 1 protein isoform X1 [Clupea harengus]|uniref:Disrupted in schizophrenia 1 protein isoform X1 n=2 Tax=Clupea harengus TaxID=7950 RepID=A0A6P3VHL0_CLUHA|nr:disrupted in schizophrenia 1 protein isoform X1 [Clupea harengus]
MFAGMVTLECQNTSMANADGIHCRRCAALMDGGPGSPVGSASRKRCQRRPGYMRTDLPRHLGTTKGEEDRAPGLPNASASCARRGGQVNGVSPIKAKCHRPLSAEEQADSQNYQIRGFSSSREGSCSGRNLSSSGSQSCSSYHSGSPQTSPLKDTFNSSFSFIQMSLDARESLDEMFTDSLSKDSLGQQAPEPPSCTLNSLALDHALGSTHRPKQTGPESTIRDQSPLRSRTSDQSWTSSQSTNQMSGTRSVPGGLASEAPASVPGKRVEKVQDLFLGGELWTGAEVMPWSSSERMSPSTASGDARESPPDSDSCSLDTEATSSLSIDSSDAASASSLTSGYESTTPSSDQTWDALLKKYDGVLQECLQSTRTNTKVESMMVKLYRLQQKAVLDDDYDSAERFGKKLEELRRERASLQPGLPSRHPAVCGLLDRLRTAVNSALQRTNTECRDTAETSGCPDAPSSTESSQQKKEHLLQEKQLIEAEVRELRARLAELQERGAALHEQIAHEEQQQELEEVEGPVLHSCDPAHLRQMGRALEDLLTSQHRTRICLSPPPLLNRLQEQEQALSLSIKEATAKVMMSQRLGASLRRKVSESETQLLALHEAKLAAISGNDFSSAKALKAEMKAVYGERDRLEGLAKKLQALSSGSSQDLARMKEQHGQLKQDLEQGEVQHERILKENTAKYIELLEDKLHSCGSPALERVWEADLEACHLILRSLQLRTPSCSGPDSEEVPPALDQCPLTQTCTKAEADCAMLTALGGRWCPEANLQHSEFTKKLEEFLFGLEDNHPEDLCSDVEDVTGQCERISEQLLSLEDQLQAAIDTQDHQLTLSLEREVKEVKVTLQAMLMQLQDEDDDEEDREHDEEPEEEEEEVEEEDEEQYHDIMDDVDVEDDHYFSDNWDI